MATRSDELTRVLKLAYEAKNFDAAGANMFVCADRCVRCCRSHIAHTRKTYAIKTAT